MRKKHHLKFFSWLVLVVMLTVAINGVHESAHATQGHATSAIDQASEHFELSVPHKCPCTPPAQHKDYDGCDTCINCVCHAPLSVQQLAINYNPIILSVGFSDPYQYLPEVFLSKFIPPQNLA